MKPDECPVDASLMISIEARNDSEKAGEVRFSRLLFILSLVISD